MGLKTVVCVVGAWVAISGCAPFEATALTPAAPTAINATHIEAKNALLARLLDAQQTGRMLSGQHIGSADSPTGTWRRDPSLRTVGAHEVSVAGLEFSYGDFSTIRDDAIDDVIDFARRGGVVTINSAPANPHTGGGPWDRSVTDLSALLDPNTRAGRNWQTMTANLAQRLQRLKDADVTVLFRPLNEANGDWFWWGRPAPEQYIAVWRQLHQHLVTEQQLDNLLWVYAPGRRESADAPRTDAYYPGADVVDVVGLSFYTDGADDLDGFGGWAQLVALGKPLVLAETGPANNSRAAADGSIDYRRLLALRQQHAFSYFLVWSSWPSNRHALRDTTFGEALLNDSAVINLQ